ncbi:MAG: transketolase [Eggerthellaceae bacterium]
MTSLNGGRWRCASTRMIRRQRHPGGSLSRRHLGGACFGGVLGHEASGGSATFHPASRTAPALYAALAQASYFHARSWRPCAAGHAPAAIRLEPGASVEVSRARSAELIRHCGAAAGLSWTASRGRCSRVGDGECQEGQVWEAAMFAAHRGLDNLVAIVDRNGLQIDGRTCDVCDPGDLGAKFAAFGWDVAEVDGHDLPALVDALSSAKADRAGRPHALIARTVKGKGVSFRPRRAGTARRPTQDS